MKLATTTEAAITIEPTANECEETLIDCLLDLEENRAEPCEDSDGSWSAGHDAGWNGALDMLRSVLIGHGITPREERQ